MPGIIFSGGASSSILMWDQKLGLCTGSLEPKGADTRVGYTRSFASMRISEDCELLLSAGGEAFGHTGRIWMWRRTVSGCLDMGSAEVAAAGINSLLVVGRFALAGDSKGNMDLFVATRPDGSDDAGPD